MRSYDYKTELDRLRADLDDDQEVRVAQYKFLRGLWDGFSMADCPAFGALYFVNRTTGVAKSEFLRIQLCMNAIPLLKKYSRWDWDIYFSPNMFREENRLKSSVRNTRLAWCDVDDGDPYAFMPKPSIIWETSPGRFQALWIWDKRYAPNEAEQYSRSLTYGNGGDKNGWPSNKLLRLPGSINHKPEYDEPFVRLLRCKAKPIKKRPTPFKIEGRKVGGDFQCGDMNHLAHDTSNVLKKYRIKLNPKVTSLMRDKRVYGTNRSAQIYHMVVGLHCAGASLDEIASVVWASPYFQSKYPENLGALHTEISRILSKQGA